VSIEKVSKVIERDEMFGLRMRKAGLDAFFTRKFTLHLVASTWLRVAMDLDELRGWEASHNARALDNIERGCAEVFRERSRRGEII
jgi:hypothetical protein